MGTSWEADGADEVWSDREAWRGELHVEDAEALSFDVEAWRGEGEVGWVWAEPEPEEDLTDWLEDLAGPEYWLFKKYDG